MSEADQTDLRFLAADVCTFWETPGGALRLTIDGERTCLHVTLRRVFPVSRPDEFISVCDGPASEVGMLERLDSLEGDVRRMLEHHLDHYYAVPCITAISYIEGAYGFYEWETETDRGPRTFYVKGRTENVKVIGSRLFVTDVDKCRYEIPDLSALPRTSRTQLEKVL